MTAVDNDGDTKTINMVINLDYVANLDANRDIILTNVAVGTPITVSADALMHNDGVPGGGTVTSVSNAVNGTVSGPSVVGGVNTVSFADRHAGDDDHRHQRGALRQHGSARRAMFARTRSISPIASLFGTVLPGGQTWTSGPGWRQHGVPRHHQQRWRQSRYRLLQKVHLFAGERIFVDVDNQSQAVVSQVEYQDAGGTWVTTAITNDGGGTVNGWFNAPQEVTSISACGPRATDTNYDLGAHHRHCAGAWCNGCGRPVRLRLLTTGRRPAPRRWSTTSPETPSMAAMTTRS